MCKRVFVINYIYHSYKSINAFALIKFSLNSCFALLSLTTPDATEISETFLLTHLDVTKRSSIEKMRDDVISKFGKIDVLVNNSGILKQSDFLEISDEEWDEIF